MESLNDCHCCPCSVSLKFHVPSIMLFKIHGYAVFLYDSCWQRVKGNTFGSWWNVLAPLATWTPWCGCNGNSGHFSVVWEFWSCLTLHGTLWQNTTHCIKQNMEVKQQEIVSSNKGILFAYGWLHSFCSSSGKKKEEINSLKCLPFHSYLSKAPTIIL